MLLGHVGAAFAAKTVQRKLPLWVCIVSALTPDLMGAVLLAAHVETKMMFWSHSLLMNFVYCGIGFLCVFAVYRKAVPALFCAALIFSHWLFDFISWPLDVIGIAHGIQVFTQSSETGLGLYESVVPALLCELILLTAGLFLYLYLNRQYSRTVDN